jgi:hypothetical protein
MIIVIAIHYSQFNPFREAIFDIDDLNKLLNDYSYCYSLLTI